MPNGHSEILQRQVFQNMGAVDGFACAQRDSKAFYNVAIMDIIIEYAIKNRTKKTPEYWCLLYPESRRAVKIKPAFDRFVSSSVLDVKFLHGCRL